MGNMGWLSGWSSSIRLGAVVRGYSARPMPVRIAPSKGTTGAGRVPSTFTSGNGGGGGGEGNAPRPARSAIPCGVKGPGVVGAGRCSVDCGPIGMTNASSAVGSPRAAARPAAMNSRCRGVISESPKPLTADPGERGSMEPPPPGRVPPTDSVNSGPAGVQSVGIYRFGRIFAMKAFAAALPFTSLLVRFFPLPELDAERFAERAAARFSAARFFFRDFAVPSARFAPAIDGGRTRIFCSLIAPPSID